MAVLNKYVHGVPDGSVYIGRGSKWGNPFKIGVSGTREEVIEKYRKLLYAKIENGKVPLKDLAALHGKDLVCYCAPKPCHGDVLEKAAAWAKQQLEVKV